MFYMAVFKQYAGFRRLDILGILLSWTWFAAKFKYVEKIQMKWKLEICSGEGNVLIWWGPFIYLILFCALQRFIKFVG